MKMSMECWWTDNDRRKAKYSEKNLSQSHFVHHRSYMDRPGIEPGISPLLVFVILADDVLCEIQAETKETVRSQHSGRGWWLEVSSFAMCAFTRCRLCSANKCSCLQCSVEIVTRSRLCSANKCWRFLCSVEILLGLKARDCNRLNPPEVLRRADIF